MINVGTSKTAGREQELYKHFWQLVARNDCEGVKAFMADKSDEDRQNLMKSRPHGAVLMSEIRGQDMERLLRHLSADDGLDEDQVPMSSAYYEWAHHGVHFPAQARGM